MVGLAYETGDYMSVEVLCSSAHFLLLQLYHVSVETSERCVMSHLCYALVLLLGLKSGCVAMKTF